MHGLLSFLVLSCVKQTRVTWTLSLSKAAWWRSSLFQKFRNGKLYSTTLTLKVSVRRFQGVLRAYSYSFRWKPNIKFMRFWVITSDDEEISSFIFLHVMALNRETYIKCRGEVVLPWIKKVVWFGCTERHINHLGVIYYQIIYIYIYILKENIFLVTLFLNEHR